MFYDFNNTMMDFGMLNTLCYSSNVNDARSLLPITTRFFTTTVFQNYVYNVVDKYSY